MRNRNIFKLFVILALSCFIALFGFGSVANAADDLPAPEALATESIVVAQHEPTTFCHKPGEHNQQELTTDDDGFLNGHLNHGDTLGACPALFDGWVTWKASNYVPVNPTLGAIGLPQTIVGFGQLIPEQCGVTYQQDHYVGALAEVNAVLEDGLLGGTVQHPEDSNIVTEWAYVSSDACQPPVDEPPVDEPPVVDPPVIDPPVVDPPVVVEPPVVEPPVVEPPVVDPPVVEELPVVTPPVIAVVDAPLATVPTAPVLAATGSGWDRIAPYALGFLMLGIVLSVSSFFGRRYIKHHPHSL